MTPKKAETMDFKASTLAQTDAELLQACRAGDETAWLTLVERFQKLVCAVPRRAGLDEDSVADVFQEVFIALFEKMHDIEQPDRLRAWLVTTAKFKTWRIASRARSKNKSSLNLDDENETNFEIADEAPLADAVLIELEEQHLVRTAVTLLDERCREILTMLYLAENPAAYQEVADKIGVGATSISPLRARCLKKMLKILQK